MSIFSKAWKAIRGTVGGIVSATVPVVGPALGGLISGTPRTGAPAVVQAAPQLTGPVRTIPSGTMGAVLPGAGMIAAGLGGAAIGAAAGSRAVGTLMSDGTVRKRRRRRRGISASELKNHARVERFLQKNYKCKHGGSRGSYVRRSSR